MAAAGATLPRRRENKPLRGNDDTLLSSLTLKTCVRIAHHTTADILHPMWTHTWAGTSSPSFVRILVQFLTFLNNSAWTRIARSYGVLNMPKRARDKGQEARLQLALLLHTIGRQIHFVAMHAALSAINFVPAPPPLRSFCFANAVDVWASSLSLL